MPDDLAEVAAASPENIEIASKGIASETLLHLQGQAAHAAPHVRVPRRDPYPNAGGDWDHGLTDRSTADTSPGETPAGIRTHARSNSTVIAAPVTGNGTACTSSAERRDGKEGFSQCE